MYSIIYCICMHNHWYTLAHAVLYIYTHIYLQAENELYIYTYTGKVSKHIDEYR